MYVLGTLESEEESNPFEVKYKPGNTKYTCI